MPRSLTVTSLGTGESLVESNKDVLKRIQSMTARWTMDIFSSYSFKVYIVALSTKPIQFTENMVAAYVSRTIDYTVHLWAVTEVLWCWRKNCDNTRSHVLRQMKCQNGMETKECKRVRRPTTGLEKRSSKLKLKVAINAGHSRPEAKRQEELQRQEHVEHFKAKTKITWQDVVRISNNFKKNFAELIKSLSELDAHCDGTLDGQRQPMIK